MDTDFLTKQSRERFETLSDYDKQQILKYREKIKEYQTNPSNEKSIDMRLSDINLTIAKVKKQREHIESKLQNLLIQKEWLKDKKPTD